MIEVERGPEVSTAAGGAVGVPVSAGRHWGPGAEGVAEAIGEGLSGHLDQADFTGKAAEIVAVPCPAGLDFTTAYFVGLGDDPDRDALRRASGSLGRASQRAESVITTLHQVDVPGAAEVVATGFTLGQYRFEKYRSEPKPSKTERLVLADASEEQLAQAKRGIVIAGGVAMARDIVNEPPVGKPATGLARLAQDMAAEVGLGCDVYDEAALREGNFGGVLAVAAGAENPPRVVQVRYEPEDADRTLAVVGKGIVFDSGGLSLKSAKAMTTMKMDVSGAAVVLAALRTIALLELPVRVVGVAPLAENMPGGGAQRPGDVVTARNGKTIEVTNTDAEGRMVLADALALAGEADPDLIVDVATLTGACQVALGDDIAGMFGNEDAAVEQVAAAAGKAGERVWHMPLPPDYRERIDSDVADMVNSGPREGAAILAALFLQEFVEDRPWVHLDIAGPAWAKKDRGHIAKGGTGVGVATIVELAGSMAAPP